MPDTLVASFKVAHRFWFPTTVRVPELADGAPPALMSMIVRFVSAFSGSANVRG